MASHTLIKCKALCLQCCHLVTLLLVCASSASSLAEFFACRNHRTGKSTYVKMFFGLPSSTTGWILRRINCKHIMTTGQPLSPWNRQFLSTTWCARKTNDGQEHRSKALVLLSDLKELRKTPRSAFIFGLAGLVPLAVPPLYSLCTQQFITEMATAHLTYGALILSFVSGIQWGFFILDGSNQLSRMSWNQMTWSVVPCLLGWIALLTPIIPGFLTLMFANGMILYRDISSFVNPPWFRALRFVLCLTAVLTLWTSCICLLLGDSKTKETP